MARETTLQNNQGDIMLLTLKREEEGHHQGE